MSIVACVTITRMPFSERLFCRDSHSLMWGLPGKRRHQKVPNVDVAGHFCCSALRVGNAWGSAPRAFLHTSPGFPHWRFMGLVMSRFMSFRDCTCPWIRFGSGLLISEVKQLIIINNATRSLHPVSWGRRGAREISLFLAEPHRLAVWSRCCLAAAPTAH